MAEDKMQRQRFELKYIIKEDVALAVRDFVSGYLEIDEYGATLPNFSYPVHSLYLDSDDLCLYHTTINGDKNRFKLRLRFYDNRKEAPIFFEIKRRMNNIIAKQRGGVRRDAVSWLLAGQMPEPAFLVSRDPRQLVALQNFCKLMNDIRARSKTHVAYLREAWISARDNSVRVTMDRAITSEPEPMARLNTRMDNPMMVFGNEVVLELKFTDRFPDWFKALVRVFGLMQCGAAKYVEGVTRMGPHRISRTFVVNDEGADPQSSASPTSAGLPT
jgi:VTC domain